MPNQNLSSRTLLHGVIPDATDADASERCIDTFVKTCTMPISATGDHTSLLTHPASVSATGGVETSADYTDDPLMLRQQVRHQQLVMSRLQTQLSCILSLLGIDENDIPLNNESDQSDRSASLPNTLH
jgi:hypothetical protein